MVEASDVTYSTLGWPKGQQQTPESCCSSPKQLPLPHQFELCSTTKHMRENKVLDVDEALTFTIIDSRNTKLSQHNRQIGGQATPTEVRGGCNLAYSTDLHQVLCQIEMPQSCGMHKTIMQALAGMMMRVERTKQKLYDRGFRWS